MFKRISLLTALTLGGLPGAALACACCADPGTRFQDEVELGEWELSEIARLAATGPAQPLSIGLRVGVCGRHRKPQSSYEVSVTATNDGVTFSLGSGTGPGGALVFGWPESYTWFGADTTLAAQGDTQIYTELRFRGTVTATGDFAQDGPLEAELVLSGFGNMCITTRSFSGWMLSVSDEAAQYRLFGTGRRVLEPKTHKKGPETRLRPSRKRPATGTCQGLQNGFSISRRASSGVIPISCSTCGGRSRN